MVRDFAVLVIVLVLLLPCLHYLYTFGSGRGKRRGGCIPFLAIVAGGSRIECYFFGSKCCAAMSVWSMRCNMAEMVCAYGLGGEERADVQGLMNSNCLSILQNTEEVI
jgi:hypothetical protein